MLFIDLSLCTDLRRHFGLRYPVYYRSFHLKKDVPCDILNPFFDFIQLWNLIYGTIS